MFGSHHPRARTDVLAPVFLDGATTVLRTVVAPSKRVGERLPRDHSESKHTVDTAIKHSLSVSASQPELASQTLAGWWEHALGAYSHHTSTSPCAASPREFRPARAKTLRIRHTLK